MSIFFESGFKNREVLNVMNSVEKNIKKKKPFTALDISNRLKSRNFNISVRKVSSILNLLMDREEYPELIISRINVVLEDDSVVKASLYHFEDVCPFDYMDIKQSKIMD